MTWSFAQARQAAARIRAAPLGLEAIATIRPPSVYGLARDRAPLPLLLWIAARDGLVVEQDNGGFAVLQRPAQNRPGNPGGYRLRLLRRLDRQWSFQVFGGPPALGMLAAVCTALAGAPLPGIVLLAASVLWVAVLMTSMLALQLRWVARMGAPSAAGRGRASESLPFLHWSVGLLHQPEPDRVEELIRLLTERLTRLIQADLQASAGDRARVGVPEVTETIVILTRGISTEPARAAVAESLRAIPDFPAERDVIILTSPARPGTGAARRPVAGGGFLVLYTAALAIVVAVCALFVASTERAACEPASCAGRPATYSSALRYLLQRLLFSDPAGLSPATTRVTVLGWLISVAAGMLVVVAIVAGRQEIARNRQANSAFDETMIGVNGRARALILVVTEAERDAVLAAARARTGRAPVLDQAGERTIYTLGTIAGTEILLAQAGEQGTAAAAGMMITARAAIGQSTPDCVILTGICFGLHPEEGQQVGDIVVARRVHNIDPRKVTDDEARPVIRRGVNVGCSPVLLDRLQAGQSTWTGARVHFGTVLSSNTLVNSEKVVRELREEFPDAIAGEMEGAGVYEASTLDSKPDWIMVKAISDWGYQKTDQAQAAAARNAAGFVLHVMASGALRRRR